jgi:hypothetical protein
MGPDETGLPGARGFCSTVDAESAACGKLAEKYGLVGAVGTNVFARLTEGQHPRNEEQLVPHRTVQ